jgi:hypothetical protein
MKILRLPALAGLVASLIASSTAFAQYADSVISYTAGSGIAPGYNNPLAALGGPTIYNGYQNTDPFNPPYLPTDIVGLGTGGSITLQFNQPIQHNPWDPYGLDFIVFGHSGFTEDFDTGTTDGTLFTGGTAKVKVSVSSDGTTFYPLDPAFAPQVDGLYPTDASGNPFIPVNPALTASDFAGQDLEGIEALYDGSAGGAGFDIDWAINSEGQPVDLPSVNYVRLDDISGVAYIDAVSIVPEPSVWALALLAGAILLIQRRRKTA